MPLYNTDAIVLKQFEIGEADKIITFYTKEMGKVRAVAKGVRKPKSSISGLVLPFTYCNLLFYRGRSLDRINQINNKFSFIALREDLTKMAYASYMAELIDRVSMENNPNQELFALLLTSFYQLLKINQGKTYLDLVFKVHLLRILGLQPDLDKCVLCNNKVTVRSSNYFSIDQGGVVCEQCNKNSCIDKISGESLQVLRMFLKNSFEQINNLRISDASLREIDRLVDDFIHYHLEIELKSESFLHMIKNLG